MSDPDPLRSAVERLIQQWREKSKSLRDAGLDLAGKRGAAQKKCYEFAGASEALDLCADQSEAALAVVRAPQPPLCCGEHAPDRSGRTCDKPRGHEGDHWTYGGNELTWAASAPPSDPGVTPTKE